MNVRLAAAISAAGFALATATAVGVTAATSAGAAGGLPLPTPSPPVSLPAPTVAVPTLPPAPTAVAAVPTLPVPTPTLPVATPTLPIPTLLPGPTPTPPTPTPTPTPPGPTPNPTPRPTSSPGSTPTPTPGVPGPTPGPSGSGGGTGGGNGGGSGGGTGGGTGGGIGGGVPSTPGTTSTGPTVPAGNLAVGGGVLVIPQATAGQSSRTGHSIQPGAVVQAASLNTPLDQLTLSVAQASLAPGSTDAFTVTLTVAGQRVAGAAISAALISSPGQDATVSPASGLTDTNGVFHGSLHLSDTPGDHLLLAWSGAYSDEVHVAGRTAQGAAGGFLGNLPFGLSHLSILNNPVVLWLAGATAVVVVLGVLVNLGVLRRSGFAIRMRRRIARRRATRTA